MNPRCARRWCVYGLGADLDSLADVISFGRPLRRQLLAVAFWLGRIDGALWFGAWRIGPATLHPLALVYAASGSAMISATLRIPKP